MKLAPIIFAASVALGAAGNASAAALFTDTFQAPLNPTDWPTTGSAQIVGAPGGGNALNFSSVAAGGDLRSKVLATGPGSYNLTFQFYDACAVTHGCGGFIGLIPGGDATTTVPSTAGADQWLWTDAAGDYPTPFFTSSHDDWTTVSFNFKVTNPGGFGLKLEDFNGSPPGAAEDVYFRNLTLSAVPEPATWAIMLLGFIGLGGALRSQRRRLVVTA